MTEHKYTDEEVIKAVERCIKCNNMGIASCDGCLLEKCYPDCDDEIEIACLDLINRQKAEIERLHSEVKEKTETIVFLKDQATGWSIDFCNLKKKLNTAKAEAIKEFVGKLKEKAYVNKPYGVGKSVDECDVDALVKEMTEI